MKRILTFLAFLLFCAGVVAQNADSLLVKGDSLRHAYRFSESIAVYEKALDAVQADTLYPVGKIRERMVCSENGRNMVFFTDSPTVVAKHKFSVEDFFLYYPLPDKCWRRTPNQLDSTGAPYARAVYFPEQAEQVCFSARDTTGVRNLFLSRKADSLWTRPTLISEDSFALSDEIYPMLSSDGKTLWFASAGLYGVGGYDLYVSQWDELAESWSAPMNMGFPYSSPADDFLFTLSEDGEHAVFASNRDCSADSVWVYVLKYNDMPLRREVSQPEDLQRIAALDPIGYEERIENKSPVEADIPENLDTRKYLEKITEVRALQDTLSAYSDRLQKDRDRYAMSNDEDERTELTTSILQQESLLPQFQALLEKAQAELHKIEMEFLFSGVVIDPDKLLAQADREVVGEATTYTFERMSFGGDFWLDFEPPLPEKPLEEQSE